MPIDTKYLAVFEPDEFYHVYNRCHAHRKIFVEEKNYRFFLNGIKEYLLPHLDVYAYCLLPNHFHLLIKVKLDTAFYTDVNKVVSNAFRKLFITYTAAFNKMYELHGGLFTTPFRRVHVDKDAYLTQVLLYVHNNPVHHQLCSHPGLYSYSSYETCLSHKPTLIKRDEVIRWFGDVGFFIKQHEMHAENYKPFPFSLEV